MNADNIFVIKTGFRRGHMNYNESMEYMEAIKKYGSVLGLDTIKTLLA